MNGKNKVALLGNMNNGFFNLTRYLRDQGYNAHLFIFPYEPEHFHPQADAYTTDYKAYVHFLTWGNAFDLLTTSVDQIKRDVGGFDFYIACGSGPAYLAKAGIQIDLMMPYGADLYELPFFRLVRPTKLFHFYYFTRYQQKGIREAKNLSITETSVLYTKPLNKIRFRGNRLYFACPSIYARQYAPGVIKEYYQQSQYYNDFHQIRQQFDLVIFHNSRHHWKEDVASIYLKHNDMLFKSLAEILKCRPTAKIGIVTFEYGPDVQATKELIGELNLQKNVFWFPLMSRKELMIGMSLSDIVAGEFGNSWFTYGVVLESMVSEKALMHYRDDSLFPGFEMYPMIQAANTNDISNALDFYLDNKHQLAEIGKGAREWFDRNIIQKSMQAIVQAISTQQSVNVDQ